MARAVWENTILTEGDEVVLLEGNCYFRRDDIHWEYLKPSSHTTMCGLKSAANYYDVEVGEKRNPRAAWCCKATASEIGDRVAFWTGVRVDSATNARVRPKKPSR